MPAAPKTRTLLIERRSTGRMKITIPETAKVTYGTLHPGAKAYPQEGADAVLRIYEGTKQTAMFRNVIEFRDLTYEVEVERKVVEGAETVEFVEGETRSQRASSDVKLEWSTPE